MKKKKLSKKSKRVSVILAVLFTAVAIYFAVSFFSVKKEISEKEAELNALVEQYEQQVAQNEELKKTIDENDEAALAEKYARENGYVKTDERVYIDITPGKTE
ncbi:MAG: septum formation initiator family protein [Clostridia bacterium]|nr:septum formation initiator family protein [Clostridia bacterium]